MVIPCYPATARARESSAQIVPYLMMYLSHLYVAIFPRRKVLSKRENEVERHPGRVIPFLIGDGGLLEVACVFFY